MSATEAGSSKSSTSSSKRASLFAGQFFSCFPAWWRGRPRRCECQTTARRRCRISDGVCQDRRASCAPKLPLGMSSASHLSHCPAAALWFRCCSSPRRGRSHRGRKAPRGLHPCGAVLVGKANQMGRRFRNACRAGCLEIVGLPQGVQDVAPEHVRQLRMTPKPMQRSPFPHRNPTGAPGLALVVACSSPMMRK